MRRTTRIIIGMLLTATILWAYEGKNSTADRKIPHIQQHRDVYPICGTPLFMEDFKKLQPSLNRARKSLSAQPSLEKTSAWNFNVNDQHTWWARSAANQTLYYQISTTCKAVGTHCYIFVEDTSSSRVPQAAVDAIEQAFDSATPTDPTKGIYELDSLYFGAPPDVDNDPKIIIIILNIQDGFTGTGGYVAGFFSPTNEYTQADLNGTGIKTNDAEIYYMDDNPTDLTTTSGINQAVSTAAHEFQHMINFHYHERDLFGTNPNQEITFVNEGLSEAASHLCGYDLDSPGDYFANTNVDFTSWSPLSGNPLPDYSRAALFTWYLIEQFGSTLTSYICQNPSSVGITGYNDSFVRAGSSLNFVDVLQTFATANIVQDTTIDKRYGYGHVSISIKPAPQDNYTDPNVDSTQRTLQPYATEYIHYSYGKSLTVTFSSQPQIAVRAIAVGSLPTKVTLVPTGTSYTESDYGNGYTDEYFEVVNISSTTQTFTYQSSGQSQGITTQMLSYDDGYPEGYYQWSIGDTAAVWFASLNGAALDSIRVAFQRAGSVDYGIYKYTGAYTNPLGQRYGGGTIVDTDNSVAYPYPVPYPNWVTVNVASLNVDMSKQFAVGIIFTSSDISKPGLMMSAEPDNGVYHSYTNYIPEGESNRNWNIISSNSSATTTPDSIANYLIHAYMHIGKNAVGKTIEITPGSFAVSDAYPNPFNPETIIRYSIPHNGLVSIKVFDILGKEVTTLVDEVKHAGSYSIKWNGKNSLGISVGSGVYFYRVQAGKNIQTKKMVLIK